MNWQQSLLIGAAFALIASLGTLHAKTQGLDSTSPLSILELEQAIETTQSELDQLPLRLIRESGGTMGFRAYQIKGAGETAWVEVDLQANRQFDTIVVVPAVIIDESKTSSNFAFPRHFQIRGFSSAEDPTGYLLFDSNVTSDPLTPFPNKSPVIIDCPGASAQRIRFVPKEMFHMQSAELDIFTLSELLIFDGKQNIALGRPVSSPKWTQRSPIWHKQYLVDGYMPYSEPSNQVDGETNCSRMLIPSNNKRTASITLDLGQEQTLDEVRLYPVDMDHNFAVFHRAALGFPKRFRIEVAKDATFKPSTVVFNTGSTDYPSPGHRLACFPAKNVSGRYVRITATQLPKHPFKRGFIFAFAEIEVLSKGEPVSLGSSVKFSHQVDMKIHPPERLVDGISANGKILGQRSWLADLAKRNRLEVQLAALQAELQKRHLRQSKMAQVLRWAVGIAMLLALLVYLWQRQVRQRHLYQLRETLAADLHDEIGGNFSGIALLSDELAHEEDMPKAHIPQLANIAEISRASASNARSLVRFLESRNVTGELLGQMQTTAELLLAKHHHTFDVEGYKHVSKLAPKDKWHLLLFFKEALNNIAKHAAATEVTIDLQFTTKRLTLSVIDNGEGLESDTRPPTHLAMRAKKLKANLDFSTQRGKGTAIQLEKKL